MKSSDDKSRTIQMRNMIQTLTMEKSSIDKDGQDERQPAVMDFFLFSDQTAYLSSEYALEKHD